MTQKKRKSLTFPTRGSKMQTKTYMDAAKAQAASFAYRHELLLHHQRINYQNEYDRVRGILSRNNLPDPSVTRLNARQADLKKMIEDNLYPVRG